MSHGGENVFQIHALQIEEQSKLKIRAIPIIFPRPAGWSC